MSQSPEAFFEKGVLASENGHLNDALLFYEETLKRDPHHARAWMMRGMLEHRMGRHFNAVVHLERAVTADPRMYDGWCNLGIVAAQVGLLDQSEKCLKASIDMCDTAEAHINLGDLYLRQAKRQHAIEEYRAALKIKPGHPTAIGNLGQTLKGVGRWKEGFGLLQERFKHSFPPRPLRRYPLWRGEDLTGKTILLFPEAGAGDEIMAMRFAALLAGEHSVILEARPEMYRLARQLQGAVHLIVQHDEPGEEVDYALACGDLPLYLDGVDRKHVPYALGYFATPAIRNELALPMPKKFRVGLCWRSGQRPMQPWTDRLHKAKSMELDWLQALFVPGIEYVNLQVGAEPALLQKYNIVDRMGWVQDFADTAGLIAQLDLVITVDTSVAHLAGAMGKPVWNFVTFDNVWPWMDDQKRTCWYESMRLYRQPRMNDWGEPIAHAARDLGLLLKEAA